MHTCIERPYNRFFTISRTESNASISKYYNLSVGAPETRILLFTFSSRRKPLTSVRTALFVNPGGGCDPTAATSPSPSPSNLHPQRYGRSSIYVARRNSVSAVDHNFPAQTFKPHRFHGGCATNARSTTIGRRDLKRNASRRRCSRAEINDDP